MNPLKSSNEITPHTFLFILSSFSPLRTHSTRLAYLPIPRMNDNPALLTHARPNSKKSAKEDKLPYLRPLSHPPRPSRLATLNRPLTCTEPSKISFGEETKAREEQGRGTKVRAREKESKKEGWLAIRQPARYYVRVRPARGGTAQYLCRHLKG